MWFNHGRGFYGQVYIDIFVLLSLLTFPCFVTAFLLRRQRVKHGLTLVEVTRRLGAKSLNSYARYEQGKAVPTMEKFSHLLSALSPCNDFVLTESRRT